MKISEYIKQKQKILEKHGVTTILVPKDQIDNTIKQLPLTVLSDQEACPYCLIFWEETCLNCPMFKAGNICGEGNSTYNKALDELNKSMAELPEIAELIKRYNSEL